MATNHASRRVLEKIGLKYARRVDVDWPDPVPGSEGGEVEYEVTRPEWRGSSQAPHRR
jgi:RimJ/RimL family protein N-acetyltransferase